MINTGTEEELKRKLCLIAKSLNKPLHRLTAYDIMLIGVGYHTALKIRSLIRLKGWICEE